MYNLIKFVVCRKIRNCSSGHDTLDIIPIRTPRNTYINTVRKSITCARTDRSIGLTELHFIVFVTAPSVPCAHKNRLFLLPTDPVSSRPPFSRTSLQGRQQTTSENVLSLDHRAHKVNRFALSRTPSRYASDFFILFAFLLRETWPVGRIYIYACRDNFLNRQPTTDRSRDERCRRLSSFWFNTKVTIA